MKTLYVYANFDWLKECELMGILSYERVRGRDSYAFELDRQWLIKHSDVILSADLHNFPGKQYSNKDIFSCFSDSLPDRWGRTLVERRELIAAQEEQRSARILSSFDYLTGIDDFSRMGALRFKESPEKEFINSYPMLKVPPLSTVRELVHAAQEIEKCENENMLPEKKWLAQLLAPGTSLGGARPKASVVDNNNNLMIAKFPSRNDIYDVGLWEHFSHLLAHKAGIEVTNTQVIDSGKKYHVFLSRRFDRNSKGQRIHFASSLALLGFSDGDGARTGKGYLDIADFIIQSGCDVQKNLEQLYRRVAFNMCIGNCDDHFRNHGFLLTNRGWTLSPAYDLNPSLSFNHSLLVNEWSNSSDIAQLYHNCDKFFLEQDVAKTIIDEVCEAMRQWRTLAIMLQLPNVEIKLFEKRFDACAQSWRMR